MKKIICIILIFLCSACSSNKPKTEKQIPNLEFCISKHACVFGQTWLSNELNSGIFLKLHEKIFSSFENASKTTQEDFVKCIAENKVEHKFIDAEFSNIFKQALLEYDPIFDKNFETLSEKKYELSEFCKKNLSEVNGRFLFDRVFSFFKTSLKTETKFSIYLYPSTKGNLLMAHLFDKKIFLPFAHGNLDNMMSLIFRDVCRCLFEAQDKKFHENLKTFMLKNKSVFGVPAYFMLQDILSDAVGLRWGYKALTSKENSFEPNDESKELLKISKSVAQEISKYLADEKTLDFDLLQKIIDAVKTYDKESIKNPEIMLKNINLAADNDVRYQYLESVAKQAFPESNIFKFSKYDNFPLIFVGEKINNSLVGPVRALVPKGISDFLCIALDQAGKLFIIIKVGSNSKINKAFEILKSIEHFENGFVAGL